MFEPEDFLKILSEEPGSPLVYLGDESEGEEARSPHTQPRQAVQQQVPAQGNIYINIFRKTNIEKMSFKHEGSVLVFVMDLFLLRPNDIFSPFRNMRLMITEGLGGEEIKQRNLLKCS